MRWVQWAFVAAVACVRVTFCPFVKSFCLIRSPLNHPLSVRYPKSDRVLQPLAPQMRAHRADCEQVQVGDFVYARAAACAPAKKDNKFNIRKMHLFMCCCRLADVIAAVAALLSTVTVLLHCTRRPAISTVVVYRRARMVSFGQHPLKLAASVARGKTGIDRERSSADIQSKLNRRCTHCTGRFTHGPRNGAGPINGRANAQTRTPVRIAPRADLLPLKGTSKMLAIH